MSGIRYNEDGFENTFLKCHILVRQIGEIANINPQNI